jgi:hypothetical protein
LKNWRAAKGRGLRRAFAPSAKSLRAEIPAELAARLCFKGNRAANLARVKKKFSANFTFSLAPARGRMIY